MRQRESTISELRKNAIAASAGAFAVMALLH
jgi:hypothetical protein